MERIERVMHLLSDFMIAALLLLAIFLPSPKTDGIGENDNAAIGRLRVINRLQRSYAESQPEKSFSCDLAQLLQGSEPLYGELRSADQNKYSGFSFSLQWHRAAPAHRPRRRLRQPDQMSSGSGGHSHPAVRLFSVRQPLAPDEEFHLRR